MKTKNVPLTIWLSVGALCAIVFFGVITVASNFGQWYRWSPDPFPYYLLVRVVLYGIVPILAIIDLHKRRLSGRYLAIIPILCSAAVMFRVFVDHVSAPFNLRRYDDAVVMPAFSI